MNSFRLCLTTLLAYCCALMSAQSAEQWQTDYSAALEQAGKENKMVLLDFTGSDWCGWCIKLHDLFVGDKTIITKLRDEYQVVYLDIGRGDRNQDILAKYG